MYIHKYVCEHSTEQREAILNESVQILPHFEWKEKKKKKLSLSHGHIFSCMSNKFS